MLYGPYNCKMSIFQNQLVVVVVVAVVVIVVSVIVVVSASMLTSSLMSLTMRFSSAMWANADIKKWDKIPATAEQWAPRCPHSPSRQGCSCTGERSILTSSAFSCVAQTLHWDQGSEVFPFYFLKLFILALLSLCSWDTALAGIDSVINNPSSMSRVIALDVWYKPASSPYSGHRTATVGFYIIRTKVAVLCLTSWSPN